MADEVDRASEEQAVYEAAYLQVVLNNAKKVIVGSTHCLFCDTELVQDAVLPRRFCDADCRDDWEDEQV